MTANDEAERLARAKRLREEIAAVTGTADEMKKDAPAAESPRDFIHRKMREQQERDAKKPVK